MGHSNGDDDGCTHLKLVGFLQLVCIFILAVIHLWTDSKISFILLSTVHIYSLIAKCMSMMRTIFMLSIRTTKWTARKFMSTWLKEDALVTRIASQLKVASQKSKLKCSVLFLVCNHHLLPLDVWVHPLLLHIGPRQVEVRIRLVVALQCPLTCPKCLERVWTMSQTWSFSVVENLLMQYICSFGMITFICKQLSHLLSCISSFHIKFGIYVCICIWYVQCASSYIWDPYLFIFLLCLGKRS